MSIIKILKKSVWSKEQLNYENNWYRVYKLDLQAIDHYFIKNKARLKQEIETIENGRNGFHNLLANEIKTIICPNYDSAFYIEYNNRAYSYDRQYQEKLEELEVKIDNANEKILRYLLDVYENDDAGLLSVLLENDKYGNNALYYAFKLMPYEIHPILAERIAKMDQHQRAQLFLTPNRNFRTIAHAWASHGIEFSETCVNAFKHAISQSLLKMDVDGKTPLHYLAARNFTPTTQLFLDHIPDTETFRDIAARRDKFGYTVYDYAFQSGNRELLNAMSTHLGISSKFYLKQDAQGCTVFHHALKNRHFALVKEFVTKLSADEKHELKSYTDKNQHTILHYACRYADLNCFMLIFNLYTSVDLHHLRHQFTHLEKLVDRNNTLVLSTYRQLINQKTVLFDCYQYLINNYSNKEEFIKRRDHFCLTLKTLLHNQQSVRKLMLPQEDNSFFSKKHFGLFNGRDRYHQFCLSMQYVTSEQIQEFAQYIQKHFKCEMDEFSKNQTSRVLSASATIAQILLTEGRLDTVQEEVSRAPVIQVPHSAFAIVQTQHYRAPDSPPLTLPIVNHAPSAPPGDERSMYPQLR